MNWLEKVRFLQAEKERVGYSGPYMLDICPSIPSWKDGEMKNILANYSYLPKAYIEYLQEFDSTSVAFCNFFGSQEANGLKLSEEITQHKPLLKDDYFPFGSYADGSVFLFDKASRVRWWDIEDYDFEKDPEVWGETFEEFVGECLLGKRYGEFSSTENDGFYAFLKDQDWV